MRCKKHYNDLSSIEGVCACCLRERLLSLIASQEQAQAQIQILDRKHRNIENNPAIHRSVYPYIHDRNQSEGAAACYDNNNRNDHHPYPPATSRHRHSLSDQHFYRTPQVRQVSDAGVDSNRKRSFFRFFSISNIFRSRNRKSVDSVSDLRESDSTFQHQCVDESTSTVAGGAVRRQHCRDRGMSPERNSDVDDGDELNNATTEYASSESWKNTPRRTPARSSGGGGGGHRRNLSFYLSPLVRASPNRQWNQKGSQPDGVLSNDITAPVKPHLSNTKAFYANRSRKLADFGRPNQNRCH